MMATEQITQRDKSPIDQRWVLEYCDTLMRIASPMPDDRVKEALLRRVAFVQDMLEAWQIRQAPQEPPT